MQTIEQALVAAVNQGPCACPTPTPCFNVASMIAIRHGLAPPAAVCNACRGLFNPPPASPPPVAFAPLP